MSASGPSHTHKHGCTRDARTHKHTHCCLFRTHQSTPGTNHDETAKQRVNGNNDRRHMFFHLCNGCLVDLVVQQTALNCHHKARRSSVPFCALPRVCASTCGLKTGRGSQVGVCCLSLHVRPELETCQRCIPTSLNTTAGLNSRPPHYAG